MSKKRNGRGRTGTSSSGADGNGPEDVDGRRNNKTPEHSQIQRGEIRSPGGRGGKPKPFIKSEYDQRLLAEASRILGRDEHGPVNALQRLMHERWFNALKHKDEKAIMWCLSEAKEVLAQHAAVQREAYEWFFDCKTHYTDAFAAAQARGWLPPDIVHPDHVDLTPDGVRFIGPLDRKAREAWELMKSAIHVTAACHEYARKRAAQDPSPKNLEDLAGIEKHRRMLMRKVPKGWNWQEKIYTGFPDAKITAEILQSLKEQWDAECRARD